MMPAAPERRVHNLSDTHILNGVVRIGVVDESDRYALFHPLPVVLGVALLEGLWLARTRPEGYDWKA